MTIRRIAVAAAMCVALGWSAAPAQAGTNPNSGQQQDRSPENNRSSGPYSREGARHAQDQQGRGYNASDSYRQRGHGNRSGSIGRSYQGQRGDNYSPRYARARNRAQGHVGRAHAHGSHCRLEGRHHLRARPCR
jgi:hypothetical protein